MADGAGQSEAGQQGLGAASAKSSKKERKALKHKQQEVIVACKVACHCWVVWNCKQQEAEAKVKLGA